MALDLTVAVTKWVRGKEKSWETKGPAKIIIMSWFKMDLKVNRTGEYSVAELSIAYEQPKGFFKRILSFLLADWYCRWCINNMLNDAEKRLLETAPLLKQVQERSAIQGA